MRKIILILMGMFLISLVSATVTITPPLPTPENVAANLQEGGDLLPDTTYYVRVTAQTGASNGYYRGYNVYWIRQSAPSIEINFTTNDTHKSANITWNDVIGSTATNVYVSNISMNYYKRFCSNAVGCATVRSLDNYYLVSTSCVQDGLNPFSALQNTKYLPFNISKELGNIWVSMNGTNTLDSLYTDIVSQGYGDFVYYDGFHFALKGGIRVLGTATGSFIVEKKYLINFEGGITNENPNFVMSFGTYNNGRSYDGCVLVIPGESSIRLTNINLYGSLLTNAFYNSAYYYDTPTPNFIPALSNSIIHDVTFDGVGIGRIMSVAYPGISNINLNTGGYPSWRNESSNVKITGGFLYIFDSNIFNYGLPYFREWEHNVVSAYHIRTAAWGQSGEPIKIYDSTYTVSTVTTTNNLPIISYTGDSNRIFQVYNSMSLKITDENGNPLENVNVSLIDKNGVVRLSKLTYANGSIEKSDILRAVVNWSGSGASQTNTLLSPFNLTVSKTNYKDYTVTNFNITDKIDWTIALSPPSGAAPLNTTHAQIGSSLKLYYVPGE